MTSHLFLVLTLWCWGTAPWIAACTAAIWITSIGNHAHRSRHPVWWGLDVTAVHLSAGGHFLHGLCVLPFVPYMLLEGGLIVTVAALYWLVSRRRRDGWCQCLIHVLVSVAVVVHTVALRRL